MASELPHTTLTLDGVSPRTIRVSNVNDAQSIRGLTANGTHFATRIMSRTALATGFSNGN